MHSADPHPRLYRRQLALFLAAILVPCLLLVALSMRMISQERELAEKRAADERQRLAIQAGQELLNLLEKVKLDELNHLANSRGKPIAKYRQPAIALVGRLDDGQLALPWEANSRGTGSRDESEYARKIRQGEQYETISKEPERAGEIYRQALSVAQSPHQSGYARLLLARALDKASRREDARVQYQAILRMPLEVADELGIPFAFYAANRLAGTGVNRDEVLNALRGAVNEQPLLATPGAYMLRDAARLVNSRDLENSVSNLIQTLEQAEQLRRDFPKLVPLARRRQPLWVFYGDPLWLVSVAPGSGEAISHVAVVRAEPVFAELASLRSAAAKVLAAGDQTGLPLGENLPGLQLVFSRSAVTSETTGQQRLFYYGALALALSVTGLGAFVLWRDVRREMHLAGLRSQFVSSVSHELRTPLTAIGLLAETLHKKPDADPKRQSEYLETILSESQRLARMVDNVLDFSKIEQGRRIYRLGPAALPEVVRSAARAIAHPLAQLGFRLKIEAQEDMPSVRADADALQQAILNLLSNAMKYSGESREIELRLRRSGEYAVVQVTDHGLGISAAHQQRIFERFYRVPTPENENLPGTGLGLTMVAHIVEAHGGKVELQSAHGQGSTFSILLPVEVRS